MVKKYDLNQIDAIAESLVATFEHNIILLKGDLGAGKTTLVNAIAKQLGSNEEVSSPTFGIVNELNIANTTAFHMDLYRIENSDELQQFGFDEYLHNGDYCFIEWPQIIHNYLPEDIIWIKISAQLSGERLFEIYCEELD